MAGERAGRQSFFAQFSRAFAKNVFAAGANVIAIANANVIAIAIAKKSPLTSLLAAVAMPFHGGGAVTFLQCQASGASDIRILATGLL